MILDQKVVMGVPHRVSMKVLRPLMPSVEITLWIRRRWLKSLGVRIATMETQQTVMGVHANVSMKVGWISMKCMRSVEMATLIMEKTVIQALLVWGMTRMGVQMPV